MRHRSLIGILMVAACAYNSLASPYVRAQAYPNRAIQLITPNSAGSALDTVSRLLAEELGKTLGTQIIVVNKPGASATLGTDLVVKSKKDGYTLLYANTSAVVYAKATTPEIVPYDPVKDLEPLGLHCFFALGTFVQAGSPWKTITELLDYANKNPEKLRLATPGQASVDHFNLEIIQFLTGTRFTHVPLKGGHSHIALLGGHVEVANTNMPLCLAHIDSGKLRILLLSKKMQRFPNVPTITELGYKQDLLSAWFALYGPAGMAEEVKRVLVPAIEKAIKNPDLKSKIEKQGYIVDYRTPDELKKIMIADFETARAITVRIGTGK
jgi:tripartite-type tricarboxylate transporter receptor subunit TctC